MLKIRALNRESSSDEDVPVIRREAQEEIVLELYNKALRLQSEEQYEESKNVLNQLLLENIPLLENNGGLPKSMQTIKYSCHVNIGNICLKLNKIDEALDTFLLACELDTTDVTLWYKIGTLSIKENKFRQSAYAFAKGLECSENHWPCLDQLISILYAIKDTITCLEYIGKALILDSDYMKGLVLRRQIYLDNPAAKEYYRLYNPDYIWEPEEVEIEEDEAKSYLEEAQLLCDRITEVEKSFATKPLQTIPLPKPLEEFTWFSLAKNVTFLHQYIKDQGMSHFTFIDMKNCMSQTSDQNSNNEEKKIEETNEAKNESLVEESVTEEKMQVDATPERRPSQNSEANNDVTPIQTDNDEDQNMDQDNEEQDETVESEAKRGRPKGSKRKRDLLSDLQIWGWHSKRKQSKKAKEKDFTVEDAINRIIPTQLLPNKIEASEKVIFNEDSMNTMDIYNLYMEENNYNCLSPIHSPSSVNFESYFGTNREKDEVIEFWTRKRERIDAIVLVRELVFTLSKLWNYKWPKELIPLYIEAYDMFREHCDPPQVFCGDQTFEEIRDDALASILYAELCTFSFEAKDPINPTLIGYLQIVSSWQEQWQHEFASLFIRVLWLRSHLFRKENNNDLAVRALEAIQDTIEEEETTTGDKYLLSLPNCLKHGLITKQIIEKVLKHLDLINSLGSVENLYNTEKYSEVAEIIKSTFRIHLRYHPQVGRLGRPAQIGLLLHSLWYTDLLECFVWSEECLFEALDHFLKPVRDCLKWEKIIEKCLAMLHQIIKSETINAIDCLREERRIRLVESLSKIVCKQLNTDSIMKIPLSCVTPWILLHYILLREEQRQYANKRISRGKKDKTDVNDVQDIPDDELPPSISILFSAHEFLGPKGWCLTSDGELLHFILDTVLDRLDTPVFERLREKIDIHIEQSLFCLYQHPSKKNKISRHLADHNVDPLPLTWERSFQLFEFYGPSSLPEFNSYKNASISADLEQLFKRIIALVPQHCSPQQHLQKIMDYVHGKTEKCPEPTEFPNKVRSIYYLIGDFYFKQREFGRCIKYFQMDLCINPLRLDSWACLGLSYSAQLESKLNHCEKFKTETEFLDKAKYSSICFKKALEISPDPLMLWIEYGTFQYTVHSYCSRILKYESENLSMEKFEFLENQKNIYLDNAESSFEKAIGLYEKDDSGEADERWLQYYILGKIAEKKQKEPTEYLQYYMTASNLLDENKAEYPDKINYSNPQHLAVEALELHYRKHASVLKYLEQNEGKDIPNSIGEFFKKCLNSSKFLLKPVEKKPPEPEQPTQPKPVESNASTTSSFQEQFLNSLSKLGDADLALPIEEDLVEGKPPGKESQTKSEEPEAKLKEPETKLQEPETKLKEPETKLKAPEMELKEPEMELIVPETKPEQPKSENAVSEIQDVEMMEPDKKEDAPISEINDTTKMETSNQPESIILISDSEDDENKRANSLIQLEKEDEKTDHKNEPVTEVKDVQKVLDEMMVQTMKETEQQHTEGDSDVSFTEKVEEVVVKELREDKENKEEKAPNEKEKPEEETPKKVKPSDSETDTDNIRSSVDESNSSSSSSDSSSESSDSESDDDSSSSSSSSSSEGDSENLSSSEISQLIEKCVLGLEICITRLNQNYKALYRLAHLYFNYKLKRDLTKCKQLLLSEYKCKDGITVSGLFNDRKTNNFFNGIWRIPSTEIDRPGSLSAHMSRCITLLLNVLTTTNDTKTLIDLCLNLRKIPEPDKIYIKDSDRLSCSEQALTMSTQCLRSQIKNMSDMTNPQIVKLLEEIFRVYQRLQKHLPGRETAFANMLIEVYRKFIKEKIPDNVNVLELVTKFCLQHKAVEKPQKPPQLLTTPPLLRGPGIASPPVLPSPSNVVTSNITLKRPGSGRPRGRPPLPKVPGQVRQPRAKSSNLPGLQNTYNWQKNLFDQNYAYEYLKHYQDELIKQYSQNLNFAQLTQLSQMLNQGQIHNPATASAITNQLLSQSGLLNTNFMKQLSSPGNMTQASAAQLLDSLKQLSPSLKKKLGVDQFLTSLMGKSSTASTVVTQPIVTSPSGIVTSTKSKAAALKQGQASGSTSSSVKQGLSSGSTSSSLKQGLPSGSSSNSLKQGLSSASTSSSLKQSLPSGPTSSSLKQGLPSGSISSSLKQGLSSGSTSSSLKQGLSLGSTSGSLKQGLISGSTNSSLKQGLPSGCLSSTLKSGIIPTSSSSILKQTSGLTSNTLKQGLTAGSNGAHKPGLVPGPPSNTIQQGFASVLPSSTIGSSIPFKSPSSTTSTPVDDKTSKELMKDRPNLSITPVATGLPPPPPPPSSSPSFVKPSVTPPGSKTLQEKLAEKKKEQQKQMQQQSLEKDNHHSEVLKRSLNLPNIPSSLTVSKAVVHTTSSTIPIISASVSRLTVPPPMPNIIKSVSSSAKFPLEITAKPGPLPMPTSIPKEMTTLSSTSSLLNPKPPASLSTPKFSPDSGISISQVPVTKPKKQKDHHKVKVPLSISSSVELTPVKPSISKELLRKMIKKSSHALEISTKPKTKSLKLSSDNSRISKHSKHTLPIKKPLFMNKPDLLIAPNINKPSLSNFDRSKFSKSTVFTKSVKQDLDKNRNIPLQQTNVVKKEETSRVQEVIIID